MTRKSHWILGATFVALFAFASTASAERSSLTLAKGLAKLAVDSGLKPGGFFLVGPQGSYAGVVGAPEAKANALMDAAKALTSRYASGLKDNEMMAVKRSKSGKTVLVLTDGQDRKKATVRRFRNKRAHLSTDMQVKESRSQYRVFERQAPQSRRQRMGHGWNSRVKRPQKGYQRFRGGR